MYMQLSREQAWGACLVAPFAFVCPVCAPFAFAAKEYCSQCGLCDTYYVAHVKDACAFLGDGELS
jgi:hypothetical protein